MHLAFWGLGAHSQRLRGYSPGRRRQDRRRRSCRCIAGWEQDQAGIAARTAGYQRRADEWTLQANLAARELVQIGRQIIASLIAEQVAHHDYQTVKTQVQQAQDVQAFLQDKFTSAAFYGWMQGELSGLYYQYYRFACDTARKAEQTMKQELMRPELDATQFIQFNYWDSGHQGLLSGEALHLDIKRMEMAYHDNNKRELELTRHVSLRQLDPLALLTLQDHRLVHGHHARVALRPGLPRPLHAADQERQPVDPVGGRPVHERQLHAEPAKQHAARLAAARQRQHTPATPRRTTTASSTTSAPPMSSSPAAAPATAACSRPTCATSGSCRSRAPARSAPGTCRLPPQLRAFDYMTISDVILHIRYTAREAGDPLGTQATKELKKILKDQSSQALLFCLRYDFPTQWSAFVNGTGDFAVTLEKQYFPYAVQNATKLTIDALTLHAQSAGTVASTTPAVNLVELSNGLSGATAEASLTLPGDSTVLTRELAQQVFLVLQYHFEMS